MYVKRVCFSCTVPPRVAEISFTGGRSAGLRAQATCLVLDGDTPITLQWLKDGVPLSTNSHGNIHINLVNEFTSLLAIEKTTGHDSGNYTCAATNKATTTSSSALLSVKGNVTSLHIPN